MSSKGKLKCCVVIDSFLSYISSGPLKNSNTYLPAKGSWCQNGLWFCLSVLMSRGLGNALVVLLLLFTFTRFVSARTCKGDEETNCASYNHIQLIPWTIQNSPSAIKWRTASRPSISRNRLRHRSPRPNFQTRSVRQQLS